MNKIPWNESHDGWIGPGGRIVARALPRICRVRNRRAFTLVELLVVIFGVSVILSAATIMVSRLLKEYQRMEKLYVTRYELLRLCQTLRQDAYHSVQSDFEPGQLTFHIAQADGDTRQVVYRADKDQISRSTDEGRLQCFGIPGNTFTWKVFPDGTADLTFGDGQASWVVCLPVRKEPRRPEPR